MLPRSGMCNRSPTESLLQPAALPAPAAAAGDVWRAAVHYALLAEQGCPAAVLNLGWVVHRLQLADSIPEGPPLADAEAQRLALPLFKWVTDMGLGGSRQGQCAPGLARLPLPKPRPPSILL